MSSQTELGEGRVDFSHVKNFEKLAWADVLTLLKARHNPRFCGSEADAKEFMAGEKKGDAIAMIAALPLVLGEALPEAKENGPAGKRGPAYSFVGIIEQYLSEYVKEPSAASWGKLEKILVKAAATEADQGKVCDLLFKKLKEALINGIKSNKTKDLVMAMVAPLDTDCKEYGKASYPLGKTGSVTLSKDDVRHPCVFKSEQYTTGSHDAADIEVLAEHCIGAMMLLAEDIVKGK